MRMKEQFDYRIRPIGQGRWAVYEYRTDKLVRAFDSPLEAAQWAREVLIKRSENEHQQT